VLDLLKKKLNETLEIGSQALEVGRRWGVEDVAGGILKDIRERFEFPSLKIALVGKIKTGKSTLLNALLGKDILPVGVLPCSLCDVQVKRAVGKERFYVEKKDSSIAEIPLSQVKGFISTGEGEDAKRAELFVNSPILENGLKFYDTPGYSDIDELRADVVHTLLPSAEAVIVVLSAVTGGIGAEELEFLKTRVFASQISKIFFVINKSDLLESEEQRTEILDFVKEKLSFIPGAPNVYLFSAKEALEGKNSDANFGFDALKNDLNDYFQGNYAEIFCNAAKQNLNCLVQSIENSLSIQKANLDQGIESIEKQIQEYEVKRKNLHEEIESQKSRSLEKIDPILDDFQTRLLAFTKQYKGQLTETIFNDIKAEDIATQTQKIQKLLATAIERSYRDFLERDSEEIQREIARVEDQFRVDMEQWINRSIGGSASISLSSLPGKELATIQKIINPALLAGAYIGMGWINFILAAFISYNFSDTIKEFLVNRIAGSLKVREKLCEAIEEHLEKLSDQIYVDFAKSIRVKFEDYLTCFSQKYKQQFDLIEKRLEKLRVQAMNPESKITAEMIEKDLNILSELRKKI